MISLFNVVGLLLSIVGGVGEGERKRNDGESEIVVLLPATYPKFNPTFKGARYPQPLSSLAVEESQGGVSNSLTMIG